MKQKRVLVIADLCCVGQCSLTVALPTLSAMGIEACALPMTLLSTHSVGFEGYTRLPLFEEARKIVRHLKATGVCFDGIYVAYLGGKEQIDAAVEAIDMLKGEDTKVFVDPAMAEETLYPDLPEDYPALMQPLLSRADVITPNRFEARLLVGDGSEEEIAAKLSAKYACKTVVTGIERTEGNCNGCPVGCGGMTGVLVHDGKRTETALTRRVKRQCHGAGDVFASALVGAIVQGRELFDAARIALGFTYDSILNTLSDEDHFYGLNFESELARLADKVKR